METKITKKYPVQEVFDILGDDNLNIETVDKSNKTNVVVDGYVVYRQSLRYVTFYNKGCTCVKCGRTGSYFLLEPATPNDTSNRRHFNLYSDDGVLMTKDHILPKRFGGKDTLSNMQTMCTKCNHAKGCKCNRIQEGIIATSHDGLTILRFFTIDDAAAFICDRNRIYNSKPGKIAQKAVAIAITLYEAINNNESAYGFNWTRRTFTAEDYSNQC